MKRVGDLLRDATAQLSESDSAHLDAHLLLGKVLDVDRVWLMTWADKPVAADQQARFLELIARRKAGEPIAYILGYREFWDRDFVCNQSTLIPRPDTECLIELVLSLQLPHKAKVLDMGTGTGCIALTLAAERPDWKLLALDLSAEAIEVAEQNRKSLGLENATIMQSDWYGSVPADEKFDLIVANPPYIDPESPYLSEGDVRFEPDLALTSDNKGMSALEEVVHRAPDYLNKQGWVAVEHGFDQAAPVLNLLNHSGFLEIQQVKDLAGLDRCSAGRRA